MTKWFQKFKPKIKYEPQQLITLRLLAEVTCKMNPLLCLFPKLTTSFFSLSSRNLQSSTAIELPIWLLFFISAISESGS